MVANPTTRSHDEARTRRNSWRTVEAGKAGSVPRRQEPYSYVVAVDAERNERYKRCLTERGYTPELQPMTGGPPP